MRKVCVLRSGGEYKPVHVQWLARQVPGLVCISDVNVPGVAKMCLFKPGIIAGDLLYLDLDTVVRGDLSPLIEAAGGKTTMLSDFYWPEHPASGLMYIAERDKTKVWTEWMKSPAKHMARRGGRGTMGDQGFIGPILDPQRWQDVAPGKVVSYKVHCKRTLPSATVICFHGNPRPWNVRANWIPPL